MNSARKASSVRLKELAFLFLKLGTIGFGGPAAHIALMRSEVVEKRNWLSSQEFLDLVGAANMIPGPNSTELAIHIGLRRAGWLGLLVAGGCFILPATLIVMAVAAIFTADAVQPLAQKVLYGIKPVIIVIVLQALWALTRTAVRTRIMGALACVAIALAAAGVNELAVLFLGGVAALILEMFRGRARGKTLLVALLPPIAQAVPAVAVAAPVASAVPFSLAWMFLSFVKIGSVLFGSGYVLLAFLEADFVHHFGWLSRNQLLEAVAVGQVTPGPVFTTATYIGYTLGGVPGALIATVGVFLPAFIFVAVSAPFIPRMRSSRNASAFLDGINVTSLALMAVVTYVLGRASLVDWITVAIAVAAAVLLFRFKINTTWLILGGALAGLLRA